MISYFRLALKSLLLNKVRSILTMLGIIIGVGAVIILTSIVGGLQETITAQFQKFGSNTLYLLPGATGGGGRGPGGSVVNKLDYSFTDKIKNVPGVDDVSPLTNLTGSAKYQNLEDKNVVAYGVLDNYIILSAGSVTEGRFVTKSDVSGNRLVAVIGQTVKTKLFPNEDPLGKFINFKGKRLQVIGVYEKIGATLGNDQDNHIYIPISVTRSRFQIDKPSFFFIHTTSTDNVKVVQNNIIKVIQQYVDKEDFSVLSQEQSIDFITNILGILATALGGIAAISLLVGGVGIMNIMFVSVTERTREIGLRKAVGANSSNILTQFLLEAIILSLLGGLLGVLFGIGMSYVIGNFIDTALNPLYIGLSFIVSAVIGIVFGVAPAIKASKLDPIVALRYE